MTFDAEGNRIGQDEWLMLAPPKAIENLIAEGFAVEKLEYLEGLGLVLVRSEAPENFDLNATNEIIRAASPDIQVDYNHFYAPNIVGKAFAESFSSPGAMINYSYPVNGSGLSLGVIDTKIETDHPAIENANLTLQDFVASGLPQPQEHGTAIVSVLAGVSDNFRGLLPSAHIYAASVFFLTEDEVMAASTISLVKAINWMAENKVPIVNMSLTGPPNAILRGAIVRAKERGVTIVAAVGNQGPAASPLYPAAYDEVIAVTAIADDKKIYRLANRGEHVDFAAPGVDILHAEAGGGWVRSSGTSLATPFVTAAIAVSLKGAGELNENTLYELEMRAEDLGKTGFDQVYGYGLIHPLLPEDGH